MTNPFVTELLALLKRHNAEINCTCKTGCDLEVWAEGKQVASFVCHIPSLFSADGGPDDREEKL